MDLKVFYKYAVHNLKPQNTESGEPELSIVGEKYQDNSYIIICNTIINTR